MLNIVATSDLRTLLDSKNSELENKIMGIKFESAFENFISFINNIFNELKYIIQNVSH